MRGFFTELDRLTRQSLLYQMMQKADDIVSKEKGLPMRHHLKTIQPYFNQVCSGRKTIEIRFNDRNFKQDDRLVLEEYDQDLDSYSGEQVVVHVTNVLKDFVGLNDGWVAMSIHIVEEE